MRSRTAWPSAVSARSRGTPVSLHQERKVVRSPCAELSMSRSCSSLMKVLADSGLPVVGLGNTRSRPALMPGAFAPPVRHLDAKTVPAGRNSTRKQFRVESGRLSTASGICPVADSRSAQWRPQ